MDYVDTTPGGQFKVSIAESQSRTEDGGINVSLSFEATDETLTWFKLRLYVESWS